MYVCLYIQKHVKKYIYIQKIYLPFVIKHIKSGAEHYAQITFISLSKIKYSHFL